MRPEYSLSAWEQEGFTEDSARLWAGLGLSPSGALSFYEAGFSVEEARPWVEVGFRNAKICKGWRDGGFKPEETKVYLSFGLRIEHAKKLEAWGITASDLSPYCGQTKLTKSLDNLLRELDSLRAIILHGPPEWSLDDPELNPTHSDWQRALSAVLKQLTPDLLIEAAQQEVSAAELLTAQVYGVPLKDYLKYRLNGLSLRQARELLQAGAKPEDFAKGAEQGLTYAEILEVFRGGVNLSEYLHLRKYGLTPEQAEELLRAGVKPEDYVEGVKQGLAYPEILNISRRGVNLSEYLHLRKYGITLRESTFVAQGLQKIAIEGPLSVSSPLIIEKSSLTLKNLSLKTLRVSDSQVILEGCAFPEGEDFPSPRLEIVSSEVALEGVRIAGGKVGIQVRDSRLTLREVSLTGLEWVGMRVEGKTAVEGEQLSISTCGCGMGVLPGVRVQLTRPTLRENGTGIAVAEAALVLKGPGELTHHQGPAILVEKNGSLSAEELTFEKNQRDDATGQLHLVGASKVSLQKITVQNSEAIGLYAKDCPDIRMKNSTFTSNLYGAIRLEKSRLIASEVKMLRNGVEGEKRYYHQVALFDQAYLKIEKSSIEHGEGGGIYAARSKVEIADCIVADHQFNGLRVKESSTAKVVGGTFRANRFDQIAGYENSTIEVQGAVLDGDGKSGCGLDMNTGRVAIKKCQIHSHNSFGVRVRGGSGCTIEDSQLENNGLASFEECWTYAQLVISEVEKVALSDLRVIGGKGEGVYLESCKNASLSGKSIIRGNQRQGLYAYQTQLTVEKTEFQDNGKASTPGSYYYQIRAEYDSNVQLKEVQVYEGQHSGGIRVRQSDTVKLEGGSIHGHGREAICVEGEKSKMVVIGARIFENAQQKGAQVIVSDWGTAEMEDTRIQDSPHGGVLVWDGGTLILKRCQVHNNKTYNLRREKTGRVKFINMPPVKD